MHKIKPGSIVTFDDGVLKFIGTVAQAIGDKITIYAGPKVYQIDAGSPYVEEETHHAESSGKRSMA